MIWAINQTWLLLPKRKRQDNSWPESKNKLELLVKPGNIQARTRNSVRFRSDQGE
jgi:hypothetical protein